MIKIAEKMTNVKRLNEAALPKLRATITDLTNQFDMYENFNRIFIYNVFQMEAYLKKGKIDPSSKEVKNFLEAVDSYKKNVIGRS